MHVALLEDDEKIGSFVSQGLKQEGHVVSWARNGTEGLQLARDPGDGPPHRRRDAPRQGRPFDHPRAPRGQERAAHHHPQRPRRRGRSRARPRGRCRRLPDEAVLLRRAARAHRGAAPASVAARGVGRPLHLRRPHARSADPQGGARGPAHRAAGQGGGAARVLHAQPGSRPHQDDDPAARVGLPVRPADQRGRRPREPAAREDRPRLPRRSSSTPSAAWAMSSATGDRPAPAGRAWRSLGTQARSLVRGGHAALVRGARGHRPVHRARLGRRRGAEDDGGRARALPPCARDRRDRRACARSSPARCRPTRASPSACATRPTSSSIASRPTRDRSRVGQSATASRLPPADGTWPAWRSRKIASSRWCGRTTPPCARGGACASSPS